MIYVISDDNHIAKIGTATNVYQRIKTLQLGNPRRLNLLVLLKITNTEAEFADYLKLESYIHTLFSDFQISKYSPYTEWFFLTQEVKDILYDAEYFSNVLKTKLGYDVLITYDGSSFSKKQTADVESFEKSELKRIRKTLNEVCRENNRLRKIQFLGNANRNHRDQYVDTATACGLFGMSVDNLKKHAIKAGAIKNTAGRKNFYNVELLEKYLNESRC